MDITAIIIIILFVIGAVIAFKLIKSVIKVFFLISVIALVLLILASFFIYKDVINLRENWPGSEKLLLAESNGEIATGFISTLSGTEELILLNDEQIASLQSSFKDNDLKPMLGSNYKMLIMDLDVVVDEIETDEVLLDDITLTKQETVSIINSEDPLDSIVSMLTQKRGETSPGAVAETEENVRKDIGDNAEIRALAFGLLVTQLVNEKGIQAGVFIFEQYKAGNIIIYPETAIFKTMKLMPNFVINMAAKIAQKSKGER